MKPLENIKLKVNSDLHDKLPTKWKKIGNLLIVALENLPEDTKRKIAEDRRKDKIIRYQEAAKTAKTLGIVSGLTQQTKLVEPTSSGRGEVKPLTSRDNWGSPVNQMNVDIATATTPLFFI